MRAVGTSPGMGRMPARYGRESETDCVRSRRADVGIPGDPDSPETWRDYGDPTRAWSVRWRADGVTRREILASALARIAPRLPTYETAVVLDRALASPGLRRAQANKAAWLALVAYARHACTDYDDLLAEGYDRDSARHFVCDDINVALVSWGSTMRVTGEEPLDDGEDAPWA